MYSRFHAMAVMYILDDSLISGTSRAISFNSIPERRASYLGILMGTDDVSHESRRYDWSAIPSRA